ncbi:MAG: tRNA (adenosine(37)-N6)-threonylcarbamoyltransferase complex dimerization subunit type 1 TsaB [Bacillota bacterium]|nr:tRNA (adenosine(37)-N6)-threonylcarbamoyltransferase complex dimerization subunit type 1 TsaB [Bacillota bacterium]
MNILAIESSALAAGAAVTVDGVLKAESIVNNSLTHSVTLLPMAEDVIKRSELTINDIDLFAVSTGPGSFSGLRIGVTLAKTLAYGCGKKAVGVSTLKAIAYNLPYADRLICPIMDARGDRLYNALYKWENGKLIDIAAPRAITAGSLAEEITEKVIFIGDGVFRFKEYFEERLGNKASFAPIHLCNARASSVAALAISEDSINPMDLNPVYLRPSQAERERENK